MEGKVEKAKEMYQRKVRIPEDVREAIEKTVKKSAVSLIPS